ncbi:TPA: hypothetical protein ACGXMH_005105 [Bacillus mobilis]|uniref:hypothetical protein n=1 Tax=Bacillus mobilis TaxID=2026190 RepID=UPI0011A8595C|nr:hypothetical protein [Bacillus mobilis]MED4383000.1 hypothetical protein [Bacillus mobilis]HDX9641168.1 hypothetical protein [Bacillus mobilis]
MQNSFYTKWWFWFMIAVVVIVVVGGKNKKEEATTTPAELKKEIKQEQPRQDVQAQPEKKEKLKQDVQQSASGFTNPIKNIDKAAAMNAVKEKAKKDFPDDYMTQNYVAEEQSKAFDHLNGIELKSQEELNVMKKVISDFPNDFMTTKYVYEEQMKAMNKQQ